MKAIMISIKPKWVAKILNGEKTIEIRKTKPKCDLPIDVYIYCTKDNHQLVKPKDYDKHLLFTKGAVDYSNEQTLNGKVVAKFTLNKVEEHKDFACMFPYSKLRYNKATCLSEEDLEDYGFVEGKGYVPLYAWHISNLEIFDKPKELSEFRHITRFRRYGSFKVGIEEQIVPLTKAPQSICYVEVENDE